MYGILFMLKCAKQLVEPVVSYISQEYCQTCNISHPLVGYKIVDHSDVVGAVPVSAARTTSSFST